MAISGIQVINIGLPNESTGSDSLYTAFNKTKTNFNTLFACSSPYNTFNSNTGITVTANANTGVVDILNTGVTSITTTANSGVVLSGNTGNIVITLVGGGGNGNGSGTVTSVGLVGGSSNARIAVTSNTTNPIVSNGTFTIDLTTTGVSAGTYTYPTVTVDAYGRVTSISNAASVGTVTSVGVTPGTGIQVTGSPVTTSGNITIVNTGVTRISAGTGISVSGSNGNVTISTSGLSGTVTSVALTSSTLTVSGSPITAAGTITVNLPNSISISETFNANGNITGGNLATGGRVLLSGSEDLANGGAVNLAVTATYFSTAAAETGTLAAGTNGLIKTFMMVADGGDMVITVTNAAWGGSGTMTFGDVGDGCTLQYIANKWFCVGNNGVAFA